MRAGPLGLLCLLAAAPAGGEDLHAGADTPVDNWADRRAAFVRCWTVPK